MRKLRADGSVIDDRIPPGAKADPPPFTHAGRADILLNAVVG